MFDTKSDWNILVSAQLEFLQLFLFAKQQNNEIYFNKYYSIRPTFNIS